MNGFITNNDLDFMFLNKTWLNENNSATVIIESATPNFLFTSEARTHKKAGRVGTVYKNGHHHKELSYGISNIWLSEHLQDNYKSAYCHL